MRSSVSGGGGGDPHVLQSGTTLLRTPVQEDGFNTPLHAPSASTDTSPAVEQPVDQITLEDVYKRQSCRKTRMHPSFTQSVTSRFAVGANCCACSSSYNTVFIYTFSRAI